MKLVCIIYLTLFMAPHAMGLEPWEPCCIRRWVNINRFQEVELRRSRPYLLLTDNVLEYFSVSAETPLKRKSFLQSTEGKALVDSFQALRNVVIQDTLQFTIPDENFDVNVFSSDFAVSDYSLKDSSFFICIYYDAKNVERCSPEWEIGSTSSWFIVNDLCITGVPYELARPKRIGISSPCKEGSIQIKAKVSKEKAIQFESRPMVLQVTFRPSGKLRDVGKSWMENAQGLRPEASWVRLDLICDSEVVWSGNYGKATPAITQLDQWQQNAREEIYRPCKDTPTRLETKDALTQRGTLEIFMANGQSRLYIDSGFIDECCKVTRTLAAGIHRVRVELDGPNDVALDTSIAIQPGQVTRLSAPNRARY